MPLYPKRRALAGYRGAAAGLRSFHQLWQFTLSDRRRDAAEPCRHVRYLTEHVRRQAHYRTLTAIHCYPCRDVISRHGWLCL